MEEEKKKSTTKSSKTTKETAKKSTNTKKTKSAVTTSQSKTKKVDNQVTIEEQVKVEENKVVEPTPAVSNNTNQKIKYNSKAKKEFLIILIPIIIIMFISFFIIIAAVIVYIVLLFDDSITYEERFYYENAYLILHDDNTCTMGNDSTGKIVGACNYEIEDEDLTVNQKILYEDDEYVITYYYNVIDANTLELIKFKYFGQEIEINTIWAIKGKGSITNTIPTTEAKKPYYQKYNLIKLNNGKTATITFAKNGQCKVDFSSFNNRQNKTRDYLSVTYTDGTCTYTTTDEENFTINYNGKVEIALYQYMDYYKKNQKVVINSGYTMQNAKIRFNDKNYSSFEYTNGKFDGQTGEVFYYYYVANDDSSESDDNNSNLNNHIINPNHENLHHLTK